jgi:2-polyprenyl-3-methyl-5-hydroxy-6-metoxy-1,4-benzoquinol methylase
MIVEWSSGAPSEHMAEELLTEVGQLVRLHPWWQARARLAIRLLTAHNIEPPARVLDAGCGWGVTLSALEEGGYRTTGLDVSRGVLNSLDGANRELIEADLSRPFPPNACATFDAVLALDVIEHVDDDRGVVTGLGKLVKPGGSVIVSVPALPSLFSEFDRVQGHRRRYTVQSLTSAFSGTGLTISKTFWWGAWMVPVLRLQRLNLWKDRELSPLETYRQFLRVPPAPGTWAMKMAFRLDERLALLGINRTGTSLFAVARR